MAVAVSLASKMILTDGKSRIDARSLVHDGDQTQSLCIKMLGGTRLCGERVMEEKDRLEGEHFAFGLK